MTTRQKKRKTDGMVVNLDTGHEIITPSRTETLLGFKIHENMNFSEHIMDAKDALIKTLNKRIGALKKIKKCASFKAKLNIANGIFMSKILYLLPLYGGCPEYLLSALQSKQNESMRLVTGKRWVIPGKQYVSTRDLLNECGWLSIRQLCYFTTVLSIQKTLVQHNPEYLFNKITSGQRHKTRANKDHKVMRPSVDEGRLGIANSSWRWRGNRQHSVLPESLKDEANIKIFKCGLRAWVKNNVLV